ncbi:protein fem-1 homolog C-like isoform X1 [Lineus longissimus]|uniref:protein fem-1 homolog C-like isoform X1 n=2 Tax=Lineus longissimus TaxID=88925 RepID=UPI002B4EFBDC
MLKQIIKGCASDCSMSLTELNACLKDVWTCTEHNNLARAKTRLKPLDKETKKKIMTLKIAEKTPLFLACWKGFVHFVNYFLDECGADIEQKGIFEVSEDQSRHLVTPLWCAAVANKLDVVKTLVIHGANVNGESDTKSTPVRSACFMTNIDVVKYLVKQGADIHKPNINGGTCLINSVQSVTLCQFLVDNGADVNAQDNSGNLALHYAIREGRIDSVRLLVKCGSNVLIKNELGDDALQTASLRGFDTIVYYLLEASKLSEQRIIDAYELMGANYVDEKHDIPQGIQFWKKSLEMRQELSELVEGKPYPKDNNQAYENETEFKNVKDLEKIISCPDAIYMQALLIRERILGPKHKDTTFGLMYRGAVYADTHRYQRCIDIWSYALHLRHVNFEALNHETIFINLLSITKLFWEIWTEQQDHSSEEERLKFDDVCRVIEICVDQIENSIEIPVDQSDIKKLRHKEYFHTVLLLSLHLLNLMCYMELEEENSFKFRKLVHKLIVLNPLGQRGEHLLHLATDYRSSSVDNEECSRLPNVKLVQLLINCGADVNCVDSRRNTPLHVLGQSLKQDRSSSCPYDKIADLLVLHGAHVDACNTLGEVAYQVMVNKNKMIVPFDHITLKCLASKVIRKHALKYEGEVPESLKPFIEMH